MTAITGGKSTEEQLRRRDSILEAVSFMAQKLMNGNLEDCLREMMGRLGSAAAASRIGIYRQYPEEDAIALQNQWVCDELAPVLGEPYCGKLSGLELGYARWAELLLDEQVITGYLRGFPENKKIFLKALHVKSTFAVPIFVANRPWGFISFDDCFSERKWSAAEADALKVAAGIIASALERQIALQRMEQENAEREKAEAALRESENLFRNLVTHMLDCLLIIDPEGNILFANEASVKLGEIDSVDEIIGKKISSFLSPEDFRKSLVYLKSRKVTSLFGCKIVTPRGNHKYLEGRGNHIKFRGSDALLLNLRDVTGRKRADQALLEAYGKLQAEIQERAQAEQELSRYRSQLEEMVEERTAQLKRANVKLQKEIAERKKSEQKIKDLNMLLLSTKMITESLLRARTEEELVRSACNLLAELEFIKLVWAGFTGPEDFSVKPLAWAGFEDGYLSQVKITWDDSEYGRGPTGTAVRTGRIVIVNNTEKDPDFSPWREQALKRGYLSALAIPISYREEVMGYLTVYSGRKNAFGNEETEFLTQIAEDVAVGVKSLRLEKELESKHVELQKAYAELKASEEMVVQQEKLASIGQLAAGIAHEIKNPLAIILQGTEFIKSCVDDEFLADCADRIKNSGDRADSIIKGLLSYSRQGSLKLDLGDISTVLNESISLVNHQLTLKNIKVSMKVNSVPPIRFDGNQMKQVFINLLMNSIESMDSGGDIKIELGGAPENQDEILIKISDCGYGIDKETIKKIFDPFFTTKRKSGGTGLGLSTTKGIIERHKGRLSVESEIGAGTTISIYLPTDKKQGARAWKRQKPTRIRPK